MEIVVHSILLFTLFTALVLAILSIVKMCKYNKHQKLANNTFFETEATCQEFRVFEMSSIEVDDINDPNSLVTTKTWYEVTMYGHVDGVEIKILWGITDKTTGNQTARKFDTMEEAVKEYALAYQLKFGKNRNVAIFVKDSVRYQLLTV